MMWQTGRKNRWKRHGSQLHMAMASGPRSWPQLWLFSTPLQSALTSSKFFRKKLDLFANIRPARTYPGVKSRFDPFDLVVVRENTEGFYADRNIESGATRC